MKSEWARMCLKNWGVLFYPKPEKPNEPHKPIKPATDLSPFPFFSGQKEIDKSFDLLISNALHLKNRTVPFSTVPTNAAVYGR